jgi:hypothetical protein
MARAVKVHDARVICIKAENLLVDQQLFPMKLFTGRLNIRMNHIDEKVIFF